MPSSEEIQEQQRSLWNAAAPGWKKWDDFQNQHCEGVSSALLDAVHLRDGHEVLELAAGTGEPGVPAARRVGKGRVVGTDVAEDMLALAMAKARAQGVANYSTQAASALSLPFPDARFDAVICRWGIMFFPDPPGCLKETLRVMKPGAEAAFAVWNSAARNPHLGIPLGIAARKLGLPPASPDTPGPFRYADAGRLTREMTKAGFTEVRIQESTGVMDFDTLDQFWEFATELIGQFRAAMNRAEPPQREPVKAEVWQQAGALVKHGRVPLPYSSWVVSGRKA